MTRPATRLAGLAALHFVLWAALNLPALRGAWWFFDDYSVADVFEEGNVQHHLRQGRPGQMLWMLTFLADGGPHGAVANVILRLVQGGLHALAGALVALVLHERTRRPATLLAALPFVLWPYSAEPVLWRTAGEYPLAAALSASAVALLRLSAQVGTGACGGAVALLAASMLTHQLAACLGLVAWCVAWGLPSVPDALPGGRLARESAALAAGYALGAIISLAVAWHAGDGDLGRLAPAASVGAKLAFLAEANRTFFLERLFYPRGLAAVQIALVALPCLAVFNGSASWPKAQRVVGLAGVLSALVTPYAAHLAVADNQISWRILYCTPLVVGAAWALVDAAPSAGPYLRGVAALLYVSLLAGYAPLCWANSAAFPAVFEADRETLRRIERRAASEGLGTVYVDAVTLPRTMDPYGIDVRWGGTRISALQAEWSAPAFVRWFSDLEPSDDDGVAFGCQTLCRRRPESPSFTIHRIEEGRR